MEISRILILKKERDLNDNEKEEIIYLIQRHCGLLLTVFTKPETLEYL